MAAAIFCTLLAVCTFPSNILPSHLTVAATGEANCHPDLSLSLSLNGIGDSVNVTNGDGFLPSSRPEQQQERDSPIEFPDFSSWAQHQQKQDYDFSQQQQQQQELLPKAQTEQCKNINLEASSDPRLAVVQRALDFIYEFCDNLQQNELWGILILQRKLNDVREYLLSENRENIPSDPDTAVSLKELDHKLADLSSKIENAISNYDSMGFDLFSRIRHWFTSTGKSNDKDPPPKITVDEIKPRRKRSYQAGGDEATKESLIKYRRVDNTFPKYMPNAVDDYSQMADPKQRKEQDSSCNNSSSQTHKQRLSMFNVPQTHRTRVRNTQTASIDLSDSEEQSHNESNIYQAFSDRLVVDVPSMGRPLYSDAVRFGMNGYAGDLNYPRTSSSPSSSDPRLNGHSNHIYDSSVGRDNLLALEDQHIDRNQYIKLINNLTLREHEPTPPNRFQLQSRSIEKPPAPPGLQPIRHNSDDWLRSRLIKSIPDSSAPFAFDRREYSRLLESKSGNQYNRQPEVAKKPPPELVNININSSNSNSISSKNLSRDNDKIVFTIPDDDDENDADTTNKSQAVPKSPFLISRPLTKALQQRHSTSIYFSDNYEKLFTEKWGRTHEQANLARQLGIEEVEKSTEERRAYEQALREKLNKKRILTKTLFVLEKYTEEVEESEPEVFTLTNQQYQRYNELVMGSPQTVLVSKFSLNISRNDIRTLTGSCWLNDEVINFYMNLITDRSQTKQGKLPSVYAMNTFFIPRLMQDGHGAVRRWTRKVDIFSKDIIPVPVHVGGVHWCMAIIHIKNKSIRYYDSMGKANQGVLNALEMYLREESMDKRKIELDTSDFQIENVQNVPQQTNGSDCGVFSCMFAEYITRNKPLNFSQEHMEFFRKKMVLEICGGELWNEH